MATRMEIGLRTSIGRAGAALFCFGLTVPGVFAQAQASQSDMQSRAGVSLNLNLPRKWTADFECQSRLVDDLATYRASYFTIETGYNFTRRVEALASYRLALASDWKSHRYALGLEYEMKSSAWRVGFRPMIQHRTKVKDDDETGGEGYTFLRARVKVERAIARRLDAYVAVEPFFAFGADYPIDNWRNVLGLKYRCTKNVSVDLYYIYRPDYGKSYNRVFHVIGIALDFKAKVPGR
jgi:hypothetical protein